MNPTHVDARMMLKDRPVLASAGLALVILSGAGWLLLGGSGDETDSTRRYTHLHCAVCREEIPYDPRKDGETCGSCESGTYLPTVGSILDYGDSLSPVAKAIVFLLVAAVLVQGVVYLAVLRLRGLRRAADEARNRMVVCRCPFCQRKIGYRLTKAGTGVVCARCKTAFVLPTVAFADLPQNSELNFRQATV